MHFLQRDARDPFGQIGLTDIQSRGDGVGIEVEQRIRFAVEIEHDHPRIDLRMPCQRHHRRRTQTRGRVALRDMQQRRHVGGIQQRRCIALVAQFQRVVPKSRLVLAEQAGDADGRAHVAQGLVRVADAQAVVLGQVFELETGAAAVLALSPGDAVGSQGMHQPQRVEHVPARIAGFPFALVGIVEIAVQAVADEFVVEAQRVVAGAAGFRPRHLVDDAGECRRLVDAVAQRVLRGDAGDQGGNRRGQQVVGRLHEEADRLVDLVQCFVGADRRELGDPAAAPVGTEGLEVVEQEGGGHIAIVGAASAATMNTTPGMHLPIATDTAPTEAAISPAPLHRRLPNRRRPAMQGHSWP